VTAAVEHEVRPGGRLLKVDRLFEGADEVRGKAAGGAQDL
jgi:hypothetical protein